VRTAIFHDNFAQMGGAERVAEALHRMLPAADLFSTLYAPERLTDYIRAQGMRTTWMQYLPAKAKLFRYYFLLYPFAVEGVDLTPYRLVITSCFGYAKGVRRRADAVHICYCHTPMRWVWRTSDYLEREGFSPWKRNILTLLLKPLKSWEMRAARRPDVYLANSKVVAKRLYDAFGVAAEVVPPPIDTARFAIAESVDDYYLVLSRLTPYKRIDLAVQACTRLNRRLVVVGAGPDRARLESLAGPSVTFLGRQPDAAVDGYVGRCRALLFPGEEDFGMVPLEINSAGRPVIAFAAGGAVETVIDGETGVFFEQATVDSLAEAIERFERMEWNPQRIRAHAQTYDTSVFEARIHAVLARYVPEFSAVSVSA
jgi:glycosyltransferase involved in cell wall biosynthesis